VRLAEEALDRPAHPERVEDVLRRVPALAPEPDAAARLLGDGQVVLVVAATIAVALRLLRATGAHRTPPCRSSSCSFRLSFIRGFDLFSPERYGARAFALAWIHRRRGLSG
jgi:hypothetical protein